MSNGRPAAAAAVGFALVAALAYAQRPAPTASTPRAAAAADLTGYWVSVVTEDWQFRMVTPPRGAYVGIPVNDAGRRIADSWDPGRDEAAGEACRAYGAAGLMRLPGRLHIVWEDDSTLRVDTDAGSQTRRFRFAANAAAGEDDAPSWQGHSLAAWQYAAEPGRAPESPGAESGGLKVVTTGMRAGYLRKNGVPYSADAVLTEYFTRLSAPNGDEWLIVTTIVEDPVYLDRPYVTSTNFKKLPDSSGWRPTPCSAT